MIFERKKDIEETYDCSKLLCNRYNYTPILYALNIAESLHKTPPNGRYTSRRERFILSLDVNQYSQSSSLPNAVNDYIILAVKFLSEEQISIKNKSRNYFVKFNDQNYLVECYHDSLVNNTPMPNLFTRFACGWFVDFPGYALCFLDSSLKNKYEELFVLFKKNLVLCISSEDFSDEEILKLYTLGPISKVILMSNSGHVSHYSCTAFFDFFRKNMYGLEWSVKNTHSASYIIDDTLRSKVVSRVKLLIKKIELNKYRIGIYFDYGIESEYIDYHLTDLRSTCEKLINDLFSDAFHEHSSAIQNIQKFVDNCNYRIDTINGINSLLNDLNKCVYVIPHNKYLYKIEHSSTLFHETNIAGIYKELLSVNNKKPYIYFTQEELNGNGRTDIQIKYNKETIGIIEVKLLKPGDENRTEVIRKGLDQLYDRYSQNHYRRIENNIILQLVLFCYDPNMTNLINTVTTAIEEHEKRVKVKFSAYDTNRRNVIRIKLEESYNLLKTRVEYIDIIIVKLENKYNNDRLAKKNYKIS
ncbi:PD-(D/E)XK nuclease superfamily protein [Pantoea sp. PNA 14-12]|uniref:hypothetical protein n=1 Tax=Pantoea TaxID=53335 RepID=UPI00105C2C38|nr:MULTISPECIES: hypothetical protein [Pantoea]TDS71991.1 PD-(D/E)XK nuclease superfamily protein [Pantoea sp. PNA 14-12]